MTTNSHERVEIAFNKRKIASSLAIAMLPLSLGITRLIDSDGFVNPVTGSITFRTIASITLVLLFGLYGLFLLRKLAGNKPALVISDEGIINNVGGAGTGFIAWQDISEIKVQTVWAQPYIKIVVKNPRVYIDRQRSFIKRKIMAMNYRLYRSFFFLIEHRLNYSVSEIGTMLDDRFRQYKAQ